jgi:DNA-binding XRE family transcriptional regulator
VDRVADFRTPRHSCRVSTKAARSAKRRPIQEVFGTALRKRRNELGLSQEATADLAGMSRSYIVEVEAGKRNIAATNMEKLADAVDKPLWELLRP